MTAHSHSHAQAHSCTIKTVAVAELAAAADRAVQINPLNAPSIQMVRALGMPAEMPVQARLSVLTAVFLDAIGIADAGG